MTLAALLLTLTVAMMCSKGVDLPLFGPRGPKKDIRFMAAKKGAGRRCPSPKPAGARKRARRANCVARSCTSGIDRRSRAKPRLRPETNVTYDVSFLTAKENVLLSLNLIGIAGRQADGRVMELLDYLEVADRARNLPEQLSGGERQRVAIASALANSPAIILAYEPTAALDIERGLGVMRLLRKVSKELVTAILVVTHDTRIISEVGGVIHLMDGHMVEQSALGISR